LVNRDRAFLVQERVKPYPILQQQVNVDSIVVGDVLRTSSGYDVQLVREVGELPDADALSLHFL